MSEMNIDIKRHQPPSREEHRRAALRLQILPSYSRSTAIAAWRRLETDLTNRRLMCSSIWTETWLDHFGSLVPHRFAIACRDDMPYGIALLTQGVGYTAGPFRLNTWHVGTSGEPASDSVCVEYNALMVCNRDRVDFGNALWEWANRQGSCDEFRMDGFTSSRTEALRSLRPNASVVYKPARFFDLSVTRELGTEPLSRLGYSTRASIRRTLRNLGTVRGEWADSPARAEEFMNELITLHQARWSAVGMPGSYSSRRFREFHLDLVNRAVPAGLMGLFRLTSGTATVGCSQILIDNHRALAYQGGWRALSRTVSPGLATDYLCLCECLRRGYDAYDFLAGDNEHKRRLSTNTEDLVWISWRRKNIKNRVIDHMRRLKLATNQFLASNWWIPCDDRQLAHRKLTEPDPARTFAGHIENH